MAVNSNSRNENGSNPETIVEVDPPEIVQGESRNLEAEGNNLWIALSQEIGSTDCLICSIIWISIVATIIVVVIIVLLFTGVICLCFR